MRRPRLVYDDDCPFCTWAAEHAVRYGPFELVGNSEIPAELRERLPEEYEDCSHLVTDEAVYSCGESAERALERIFPLTTGVFAVLRRVPGYPDARERLYHLVSENRYTIANVIGREPPARGYDDST